MKDIIGGYLHKYIYPLLPNPKNRFLIITSGRSGSNFLISLLASHPDIYLHGEVVGESAFRHNDIRPKIRICGVIKYVKNCYKKRFFRKVVGMKFLYYQLSNRYAENWKVNDLQVLKQMLSEDKKIKILHLKRRNKLKTLTSVELARQTKEYVKRTQHTEKSQISITLSPERCSTFFKEIDANEKHFDSLFKSHKKLEIYYEDLASNTQFVCSKVLDFLGMDNVQLQSNTYKQNQRSLSQRIQNYTELKQYFNNTPYESFFED